MSSILKLLPFNSNLSQYHCINSMSNPNVNLGPSATKVQHGVRGGVRGGALHRVRHHLRQEVRDQVRARQEDRLRERLLLAGEGQEERRAVYLN